MNATPQSTVITPPPFVPFLAVPQKLGDEACRVLSPTAFKLWYHITRLTRGWRRDEAAISYDEFKRACCIKATSTISKALKELVSKGFIKAIKHTAARGRRLTSSYSLLDALAQPAPIAHPPSTPQPAQKCASREQAREAPPAAQVSQPAAGDGPPLAPACSPTPLETRAPVRDVHALLDQIELPYFQTSQEAEEGVCRDELRRQLDELIEQANEVYLLRVHSTYGTREYAERSQRLQELRVDQQRVRALLNPLEE
jgi:hypothetical protein